MAKKKKQHFVPKSYLRNWEIEDDKLFLYDLIKEGIHTGNPKTLCRENHFYTFEGFGEKDKLLIEDLMGDIEGEGIAVLRKIERGEKITREERDQMGWFIAAQKLRTPTQMYLDEKITIEMMKERLNKDMEEPEKIKKYIEIMRKAKIAGIEEFEKNPEKYFRDHVEKLENGEIRLEIKNQRECWLPLMLKTMESMALRYIESDWYILKAGRGRSFVTSDNPVATISFLKEESTPIHEVDVTFPITPNTLILLRYSGRRTISHLKGTESGNSVKELNMRTTMYAERYLFSNNQSLLEATIKRYRETWQHMKNHDTVTPRIRGKLPIVKMPKNIHSKLIVRQF